jgi:hypothetical protein
MNQRRVTSGQFHDPGGSGGEVKSGVGRAMVSLWETRLSDEQLIGVIGAGAALLGSIIGGLLTGSFEYFRQKVTKPKLTLDYIGGSANKIESSFEINGKQVTEIFIRARLRNTGVRVARDCRVYLVAVTEVDHTSTHETSFRDSMVLAWPGWPQDFTSRVLPRGIDAYVNVVSVSKNEAGWRFHVKNLFASQQELKNYKGTYRLTLLATADNAEPVELKIDVTYNQDWHSLRAVGFSG